MMEKKKLLMEFGLRALMEQLPLRNYPKLSYNVRGGVSQDSAPGVDQNLNYRGMGFSPKRAR